MGILFEVNKFVTFYVDQTVISNIKTGINGFIRIESLSSLQKNESNSLKKKSIFCWQLFFVYTILIIFPKAFIKSWFRSSKNWAVSPQWTYHMNRIWDCAYQCIHPDCFSFAFSWEECGFICSWNVRLSPSKNKVQLAK